MGVAAGSTVRLVQWRAAFALGLALAAMPIIATGCGGASSAQSSTGETRVPITSSRSTTRAADVHVIKLLEQNGAHLAKARSTRLYLDFPNDAKARAALASLTPAYTVEDLGKSESNGTYVLRVSKVMVVSLDSIEQLEASLTTIARQHGGTLDGWEAAPKP
jgi:hypothetical protein